MVKKIKKSYFMSNFFLNRKNIIFFLGLYDVQHKKMKMYKLSKKSDIPMKQVHYYMKALEYHGLITYTYDSLSFMHVVMYTRRGDDLRRELILLSRMLSDAGMWKDVT